MRSARSASAIDENQSAGMTMALMWSRLPPDRMTLTGSPSLSSGAARARSGARD